MNPRAIGLIVVAPIALMALWIGSLAVEVAQGADVLLPVRGYDPRDILRGHYVTYQVDYGSKVTRESYDQDPRCVCLEPKGGAVTEATWFGYCADRDAGTCPLFIRGRSSYQGFLAGIERFYIPEAYSESLRTVPDGATIKVRVARSGRAYVTEMLVKGEPILEYAKKQK